LRENGLDQHVQWTIMRLPVAVSIRAD
jgi:hypothetical protein